MELKENQQMYTKEGYAELVAELEYLKGTRREEIKDAIALARSFGDLSENAEYDEARNEQAKVEARIKELEEKIENAVIMDESKIDTSVVSLGSTVTVYFVEDEEEIEYSIVGSNEADARQHKISDQSPIGKALMDSRAGDEVAVSAPEGTIHLQVRDVKRVRNAN
jgi:transcription elongation factor GreA